ncbi:MULTISPECIES: 50S ribosomal protein L19e [Halobacterium]|uniref:Large ribosomal subunit protein eL19 n=5 Tax=Halobacterium salinarum TaxID=2242 RepID=RL19E_HALSA|nr:MULTISPECIES: 50S ribosomal protein L19e [Halobacterium]Q9HPB6.1 RecName: Full=Large ribosomal subunit protein eL19; AltName: Full=50S ribosomal protein L19e [Halobacterium salinarum NRC-1]AAG19954.1 50S ribosomal protein L19E [Halobacterium salinarum NRC-1]MBB6088960.1 large subunit ribosomal protein L19e [Halobacterium salinarum]MCF2164823.1 50S ribosomal protein L19e [Halobacterium salinarum]MCF2168552.1 50S ribosomal protein L19e [Halobacterium salinarum]MCF2206185.1 50S ribosomal prot
MSDLSAQKRLAADVLDVGENRVWFDPDAQSEIADAITREDIRELVADGTIDAEDTQGNSRGRARERDAKESYGHKKGAGSRKGKAGARQNEKREYVAGIRAQRQQLRELRDDGTLSPAQYREMYNMANGGEFDSVRRLTNYVEENYGDS